MPDVLPVWAPTPEQVHELISSRPVFTDTSRPTVTAVLGLITMAVDSVMPEAAPGGLDAYEGKVRGLLALLVASRVERSYFPEQGGGVADSLLAEYQGELVGLRVLLKTAGTGTQSAPASPLGAESMLYGYLPWGRWPT